MQSQEKNNELAVGLAVIAFAGIVLFAVVGLFVAVLSVVCLFAWNKPVRFMGEIITPEEAHGFVGFGVAGLVIGLVAANNSGGGEARQYFPIIGYIIGSLGFAAHFHFEKEAKKASEGDVLPPINVTPREEGTPQKQPFEFASWNDEEMH